MGRCVVGPEGRNNSNVIKHMQRLSDPASPTPIRRAQLGVANPATDPPDPEKTDPAEAGTKAGSGTIKAATISEFTTTIARRVKALEIDRRMSVAWAARSAVRA